MCGCSVSDLLHFEVDPDLQICFQEYRSENRNFFSSFFWKLHLIFVFVICKIIIHVYKTSKYFSK